LAGAFDYANRVLKKRSVVFVLSDFLDQDYDKPLRILASKHDVIAIQVLDEAELELPRAGILSLVDPETGQTLYLNSSDERTRKAYSREVQQQQEKLLDNLRQFRVDHLLLRPADSHVDALREFFERRKLRWRRR
jgi:hypothetical protein